MRIRKLIAGVAASVALAGAAAFAGPATASAPPPNILGALTADTSGVGDGNWNDFDILTALAVELGLAPVLAGDPANGKPAFNGTVFAPADASFRGLVADLTNQSIFGLTEQEVLDTLVGLTKGPLQISGVGPVPGDDALRQVVLYHITGDKISDLRHPANRTVTTLSTLPTALSDNQFTINRSLFGIVGLRDDDSDDLNPFWFGRTIRTADGGTIHAIAGVLRPFDFSLLADLKD
jgi:hypothetical protein